MTPVRKPTIAIITFPAGGPLSWGRRLADGLTKRGFDVSFFAGRTDYIKAQLRYFDIVHTCVPIPHFLNKKYILTVKGNYQKEKAITRPFFRFAIRRADAVTVPSEFLKKELALKNALVIPNGIAIVPVQKNDHSLHGAMPTVGILTNFHFRPKAEGVARLAGIMKEALPEAKLLVGGSGIFLEEYKKRIFAFHPNTTFLGHCDKNDLFSRIDIFAYYSLFDNQPNAVLEAMAYGLPVISSDIGAIREIMGDESRQTVFTDDATYGKALLELAVSQEKRESLGRVARARAEAFDENIVLKKYMKLYA